MNRLIVLATAAVLALCAPAYAATVFYDDFDTETPGLNATLTKWDVSNGTIDVIPANNQYDFYPSNGLYVDLDGSSNDAGVITTKDAFTFALGQKYRLSFYYGKNPNGGGSEETITMAVTVALGDLLNTSLIIPVGFISNLIYHYVDFIGDGTSGKLSIGALGGDNQGPIIDRVRLAAIPIPAALPLLAGALGGLGLWRWRRTRLEKRGSALA